MGLRPQWTSCVLLLAGLACCDVEPTEPPTPAAAPVISRFEVMPGTLSAGESATLSWDVSGATSVSIDQGIGVVRESSLLVHPLATTTYTLLAEGPGGSASARATVSVSSQPTPPSSARELTAFSFQGRLNGMPVNSDARISGTRIRAFVPPGTSLTSLRATFEASRGATVTVGGVPQVNGVTANDFTQPVTYRVMAEDGSSQSFTVMVVRDLAAFDDPVTSFMATHSVPAVSIAVTHNGRLIYLKAYGQQDKGAGLAATPKNLFRLASVSKPITAVAILRLVEQGKLKVSDKVFGAGALLGTTYGTKPYGQDVQAITVDHLLHHTAGGWSNTSGDPMFMDPSVPMATLIGWTLDNVALTSTPGTAYAYSNFGYCLLGRIIEKVTGKPYEQAVQELVLQPAGISDMVIGGNTLADRRPNEVVYYGLGENPYAYNITRMDAHGGWIATARDLAAFLVAVDGFNSKPDLLAASTTAVMTTPSSANPGYAAGWLVNSAGNWWHNGSLPGTATEIIRGSNGYTFVVLANLRNPASTFFADMDALLWTALSNLQDEPSYDLFP